MTDGVNTVPLVELLRKVPKDARIAFDDGPHSTYYCPIGRHCHEAADEIERLQAALSGDVERVLLMRSAEVGRWIQADGRSISGEYRYATLDPKEGE